jgi:hypothetical protein
VRLEGRIAVGAGHDFGDHDVLLYWVLSGQRFSQVLKQGMQ